MDITLVSLPKSSDIKKGKETIPVALLYLSSYLNRHGIKCDFIDFSSILSSKHTNIENHIVSILTSKLSSSLPILGFNCFSSYQFPLIMNLCRRMKNVSPNTSICIGGSHPTMFAEEILNNCEFIDYVVIGEGEETLLNLSEIILNKSNKKIDDVQSIGYRDTNKNIHINPRNNYLTNLNINPEEMWKSLKFEDYYSDHSLWNNPKKKDIKLAVPILSSRSCPFSCNFCSASKIMGSDLRYRDAKNVVDEIEYLNKHHGQDYFEFIDDNINVRHEHAMKIFSEIINRKLDIQISLASGIHLPSADEALIHTMAKAGLAMIKLPIEHGNDYIRNKIIGKKLSREKIFEIVHTLKEYDIFIFGLFIMGFPEDTSETLNDSYNLMLELKLDIYETASLIPFPGTKLFNQCMKDNLLVPDLEYKDLWKGTIKFDGSEHDKIYIKPYNMTIDSLKEYREKFNSIRLFSNRAKEYTNES